MSEGFVYILTNAAMPGFVKIGMSAQADVSERVRQLDNTSAPLPFEVYYAARVPDCRRVERTLHFVFGERRARLNREFFRIDPDLAKAVIELVEIQAATPSDREQGIAPEVREEIEAEVRTRTGRLDFQRLGLPVETELAFSKDPAVTCTVAGSRTVHFQGEEQSPSAAALKAIRAMGYSWSRVNGFDYWTHEGVKLSALQPTSPEITQGESPERDSRSASERPARAGIPLRAASE